MKFGTKLGWILVAFSIILSIWVISGIGNEASTTDENGFVIEDDGVTLSGYTGVGGNVTIPSGITTIASGVFADNSSITAVTMPDTVTSIGTGVFSGCTGLSAITLSGNLTSIPDSTFYNCTSLSAVALPYVSSIGSNAFYGCASMSAVALPATVSSIGTAAFDECPSMSSITVGAGNASFTSYDGCLYNISGTNLIRCPEGKGSLNLSSACTTISTDALKNCSYIDSVTIPATVTAIGFQTNWLPSVIYGYSNSAAEAYAAAGGILFEVLDTAETVTDDTEETEDTSEEEETEEEQPAEETTTTDNGTTTTGGSSTSGGSSGDGGHVKDTTPKTADGDIDPRYFLSLGFLLVGISAILYSKKQKIHYVQELRNKK